MKVITKPLSFLFVFQDPTDATKLPAWHVEVMDFLDREDGSRLSALQNSRRVLAVSVAEEEGFGIETMMPLMDTSAIKGAEIIAAEKKKLEESVSVMSVELASLKGEDFGS